MKIKIPAKNYDPLVIESKRSTFWDKTNAYQKRKKSLESGRPFYFADKPQNISGDLNLEHARNMILKDALIRYKRMNGEQVRDQPGFSMHGLDIERKVAHVLSLETKAKIEESGLDEFGRACKDFSEAQQQARTQDMKSLGIWMDWHDPYLTSDEFYSESIWWSLKKAYKMGQLVREKTVRPWCPGCETVLGESDIQWVESTDPSVYLKFPIKGRRDEFIVTWTTEPWTVTGTMAIAINPDLKYARVSIRKGGRKETLIVLEEKLEELAHIAGIEAYEIIETVMGIDLRGLEYFHPMMADIKFIKNASGPWVHKIVTSEFVRRTKTGAVHISPGLGQSDYRIAADLELPAFCPVDEKGVFTTAVGMKYASLSTTMANRSIVSDLEKLRFVLHAEEITHKADHCRYCKGRIIHRRSEQWLLRTSNIKDRLVRSIGHVSWLPEKHNKERQYERDGTPLGVQKTEDWCISRQRFWGTPMPVWECLTDICGHTEFIGSLKELSKSTGYTKGMDLHLPNIDNVSIICPKCSGLMRRVPDIIDVGYEGGIASWGQLVYPRKKKAFKKWWPATMVSESYAETRSWYYDQMKANMLIFGKIPYKSALVQGRVMNPEGTPYDELAEPELNLREIIEEFGADPLRLFLLGHQPLWHDLKYDEVALKASKYSMNVLWNIYQFATRHASMDKIDPASISMDEVMNYLEPEDRWLLSRAETLTNDVRNNMERYEVREALDAIEKFILDDISRWYIKIVRKRTRFDDTSKEKVALCKTLHEVLIRTAVVASPFMPFITEEMYQNLDGSELSIHNLAWPDVNKSRIDKGLETAMNHVKAVVKAATKARQRNNLKLRWPVKNTVVEFSETDVSNSVKEFEVLVKRLLNAKNMEFIPPGKEWEGKELSVIPNPAIIGKAYKQWESKIAMMLKIRPAKEIQQKIEEGNYFLGIEGQTIKILPEMVAFSLKLPDNFISAEFEGGIIYIDVEMDDELSAEGYTNDIIRRIQDMRKDMELDIEEYIRTLIILDEEILDLLLTGDWLDKIAEETHSGQVELVDKIEDEEYIIEWNIQGHPVTLGLSSMYIKEAIDLFSDIPGSNRDLAMGLVDAGIYTEEEYLNAERDDLLKIQGFSHSTIRKMREYLETPPDERPVITEEEFCPFCEVEIDPGSVECMRCGNRLIGDEGIDVDFVGDISMDDDFEDEDEDLELTEVEDMEAEPTEAEPETRKVVRRPAFAPKGETGHEEEFSADDFETETEPQEKIHISVSATKLPDYPTLTEELAPEGEPEDAPGTTAQKLDILGGDKKMAVSTMANLLGIKPSLAKTLYNEGYDSLDSLRNASEEDLKAIKGIGKATARKIQRRLSEDQGRMCSLCNAIVPSDASECPRCGTIFADGMPQPAPSDENEEVSVKDTAPEEELPAADEPTEEVSADEEESVEAPEPAVAEATEDETAVVASAPEPPMKTAESESVDKRDPLYIYTKAMGLKDDGEPEEALDLVIEGLKINKGHGKLLALKEDLEVEIECKEEDRRQKLAKQKSAESEPEPVKMVEDPFITLVTDGEDDAIIIQTAEVSDADEEAEIPLETPESEAPEVIAPEEPAIEEGTQQAIVESQPVPEEQPSAKRPEPQLEPEELPAQSAEATAQPAAAPEKPQSAMAVIAEVEPEEPEVELKESFTYLIPEDRSKKAYGMFINELQKERPGYLVTRMYPVKLRSTLDIGDTPILWLSNVGKEDSVRPKDLEKLSLSLEQFLSNEGGVIMVDGIEYLITNNNFITVLRLIQSLRDQVAINRSILLISVNPSTLEKNQINLLEREVDMVL